MSAATKQIDQNVLHPTASKLYDGEVIANILGHPCIYRYLPPTSRTTAISPDRSRPLMVFIPGGAHLARMAYGVPGHPSYDPSDFLAHHLNDLGFPFLGISYPLESAEPRSNASSQAGNEPTTSLMPATSYDFRITDWGKQAAEVTAGVISEQQLSNDVVLVVWSMGGRMAIRYTQHAKNLRINVKALFPLAASSGLQTANPPVRIGGVTKNGYSMVGEDFEKAFLKQIHIQQDDYEDRREVLPDDLWRRDYFGYPPVALMGLKLRSVKSDDSSSATPFTFVDDEWQGFIDSDTPNVANLPSWIASIYSNSKLDAKHGLMDRAVWGSLLAQKIMSRADDTMARSHKRVSSLSDERWQRLMRLVHSLPDRLSQELPGTHFFFLGRTCAQRTAASIGRLLAVTDQLEGELRDILEEEL